MYTKKDFEAVAKIISANSFLAGMSVPSVMLQDRTKVMRDELTIDIEGLTSDFIDLFSDNPNFDEWRFRNACKGK